MSEWQQPDLNEAWERAQAGADLAADHAGDDWKEDAFAYVCLFAARHQGQDYLAEQIRGRAEADGIVPPDPRAWGHVFLRAAREGVIERNGYARASNCCQKVLWRMAGKGS